MADRIKPAVRRNTPAPRVERSGKDRAREHRPSQNELFDEYFEELRDVGEGQMGDFESDEEAQHHSEAIYEKG
jgi:hypothetical protein